MVIMVRSMIMHSMAIAVVAARARCGPVSGSQRMRRPVVARVPPAVAIATMISGMTGIAARSAIRPVRQGLGSSRSSHQIPTSGPVAMKPGDGAAGVRGCQFAGERVRDGVRASELGDRCRGCLVGC